MSRTNCGRLRQVSLTDLTVRVAREGVLVEAKGLVKGDDLLTPQGMVYFEWKNWSPEVTETARELLLKMEKHVAVTLSVGDVADLRATEPANVLAERKAREAELAAFQPRPPGAAVLDGAPLPPDLFDEDGEVDIASTIEVESQY